MGDLRTLDERAAGVADVEVDGEVVDFVSGGRGGGRSAETHPDMLLQHKLHEALDAHDAARVRTEVLMVRGGA